LTIIKENELEIHRKPALEVLTSETDEIKHINLVISETVFIEEEPESTSRQASGRVNL
jgi:hypothetical protein